MVNKSYILIFCLCSGIAACKVGPDYVRPQMAVPANYKELQGWKSAEPQDESPRGNWWEIFGDATLNQLIAEVAVSNQSIKAVEAQYRQAQALTQQAQSAFYPLVTGDVSATRSRPATNPNNTVSNPKINTAYRLGADISWEPDLWGRIRRNVEAGQAGAAASSADIAAATLSAQALLAQNYLALRVIDMQKKLLQDTVEAYEKSLKLTENQYKVGIISRADVATAETQLKTTQAQLADLGITRSQLEHAIAVLVGKAPAEFTLAGDLANPPKLPSTLPIDVPSKLLERRPDIAAAERRAAQANANIGVAEAAYFPDLTLSGSLGFQSTIFSKWLTYPARFWTLGPALAQTIFDGGLRKSQKAQAAAIYDESVANYRQTILNAFQEVEDNLSALKILEDESALQAGAVNAARESAKLTMNQYRAGTVSYINVVNVETIALTNERTALNIENSRLNAAVLLIKALGGSWHPQNNAQ